MLKRKSNRMAASQGGNSRLVVILVLILVVTAGLLAFQTGARWQEKNDAKTNEKVKMTSHVLEQQLKQIGELSTVKYIYTNMGKYENTKQAFSHDIPLTTKSFTISYDGTIKAGVALDQVKFEIQDEVITITVPKSTILSNDVDLDSVTVYDEKSSIFNGLSTQDVTGFLAEQEDKMKQKAVDGGILEEADDNAISTLTTLFSSFLKNGDFDKNYKLNVATTK